MANIKNELNNIKSALYGKDVRSSIHNGIDAINKEVESTTNRQVDLESTFDQLVISAGNSNAEIVDARVKNDGTSYSKLGDRLNEVDSQLAHIEKNVRDFGVIGDGVVDDTIALQIALNNSINTRLRVNKDLKIRITDTIIIPENIELNIEGEIICDGDVDYWLYGLNNDRVVINEINGKIIRDFNYRKLLNRFLCLEKHNYFEVKKAYIEGASTALHSLYGEYFKCGDIVLKNVFGTGAQYGYGINTSSKNNIIDNLMVYNDTNEIGRHMLYLNGEKLSNVIVDNIKVVNCNKNPININISNVDSLHNITLNNIVFDSVNISPLTNTTGAINLADENNDKLTLNIGKYNINNTNSCVFTDLSKSKNINIDTINITNIQKPFADNIGLVFLRFGENKKINNLFCNGINSGWQYCLSFRETTRPIINNLVVIGDLAQQALRLATVTNCEIGNISCSIEKTYISGSTYYFIQNRNKVYYSNGVNGFEGLIGDVVKRNSPRLGDCIGWVYTEDNTWVKYGQVGKRTCDGDPNNVITPYFLGEEILDTNNLIWYKSVREAIGGWKKINE